MARPSAPIPGSRESSSASASNPRSAPAADPDSQNLKRSQNDTRKPHINGPVPFSCPILNKTLLRELSEELAESSFRRLDDSGKRVVHELTDEAFEAALRRIEEPAEEVLELTSARSGRVPRIDLNLEEAPLDLERVRSAKGQLEFPFDELEAPSVQLSTGKGSARQGADEFVSGWRRLTVEDVPLPANVRETFGGGTATGRVLSEDTTFYRVAGGEGGRQARYLTRVRPSSPEQAIESLALDEKLIGNTAAHLVEVKLPKGTVIWEGTAARLGTKSGGGSQIWVSSEQLFHLPDSFFKIIPW